MNKNKYILLLLFAVVLATGYQNCAKMASDESSNLLASSSNSNPGDVASPPDSLGLNRFVFNVRVENLTRSGQTIFASNDIMRVTIEASSDIYGCGDYSTGTACNQYSASNVGLFRPLIQNYSGLEGFQCSSRNANNVVRCVRDDRPAALYPPGQYQLVYATIVPATAEVLRTSAAFAIPQVLPAPTPTPTPIVPPPGGILPPPTQPPTTGVCPSSWSGQPWANFTRYPATRLTDLPSQSFSGRRMGDFPASEGLGAIFAGRNEYVSLEFTATTRLDFNGDGQFNAQDFYRNGAQRLFSWIEVQYSTSNGVVGGSAGLYDSVYFTISQCPGDFRLPTSYTAPANDPTLSYACRSVAPNPSIPGRLLNSAGIAYEIDRPNADPASGCKLTYGARYYLNFMTVNVIDGYQPGEHNCRETGSDGRCGQALQMTP